MTLSLTFIRAIHMGSCLVLTSVFILLLWVVIPASGCAEEDTRQWLAHFYRLLGHMVIACLLTCFASGALWLWFVTADMSGTTLQKSWNSNLLMVLRQTEFGHLWELRFGIALALAAMSLPALKFSRGIRNRFLPLHACALLSTVLLGTLAWAGHGGATDGTGHYLHLVADAVHLIAAGVWPSSLLPFAFFLVRALKSRTASLDSMACETTRRFSLISLVTVGVLALSGIINSYFLVGNIQELFSTGYGRLLLLKLALFMAMISFGAWNLLFLKPRLAALPAVAGENQTAALRAITRNVIIELCLGTLVLLVVGVLGITPPAIHCPMP